MCTYAMPRASQNFVRHSCHMLSSPEDDKWLIVSSNAEASVSARTFRLFRWSLSIPVGLTAGDMCTCFVAEKWEGQRNYSLKDSLHMYKDASSCFSIRKDQRIEVRAKSFALHSPFARNFFVTWVSCEHGLLKRSGVAYSCSYALLVLAIVAVHVGPHTASCLQLSFDPWFFIVLLELRTFVPDHVVAIRLFC